MRRLRKSWLLQQGCSILCLPVDCKQIPRGTVLSYVHKQSQTIHHFESFVEPAQPNLNQDHNRHLETEFIQHLDRSAEDVLNQRCGPVPW